MKKSAHKFTFFEVIDVKCESNWQHHHLNMSERPFSCAHGLIQNLPQC